MRMASRVFAILLIVALLAQMLPVTTQAANTVPPANNIQKPRQIPSSGWAYDLSLAITMDQLERSVSVNATIEKQLDVVPAGLLIVTLYANQSGKYQLIDLFTRSVNSDTHSVGELSFEGYQPDQLAVKGVIINSLDNLAPLSAFKSYTADQFTHTANLITTLPATDVTKTTAVIYGKLEGSQSSNPSDYGFVVVNKLDPQTPPVVKADAVDPTTGIFSKTLTGLVQGQEYQYIALSTVTQDAHGLPLHIITLSDFPEVVTGGAATFDKVSIYSQSNLAYLIGTITNTKGLDVTESGFQYGTDPVSLNQTIVSDWQSDTRFSTRLINPDLGVTYYYRAYAKNSAGTGYGEVASFTMPTILPIIKRWPSVTFDKTTWKLTARGEVEDNGGSPIIKYGFRYRRLYTEDWIYLPVDVDGHPGVFSVELNGIDRYPPGNYEFQCYVANSVGMVVQGCQGNASTPDLPSLTASYDQVSVGTFSVTLKGNITGTVGDSCSQRGFDYKPAGSNTWIDAITENGTFGIGAFAFTLDTLKPYTQFVFRAKAKNSAGWSYSPVVAFTTLYSNDAKETAYRMKADSSSGIAIASILKVNLNQTLNDACQSLKFAGYSAPEIAAILKGASYKASYADVIAALRAAGFDVLAVTDALQKNYLDAFEYIGAPNLECKFAIVLKAQGYSLDEIVRALKEVRGLGLITIAQTVSGFSYDAVYASYARLYGALALANAYWQGYNCASKPSNSVDDLAKILKNDIGLNAQDCTQILYQIYPGLTPLELSCAFRWLYSLNDAGEAMLDVLGTDITTAAGALADYYDQYYDQTTLKTWLKGIRKLDATQMVSVLTAITIYDPRESIPGMLKNDYGITSAPDAARALYGGGWNENLHNYCNLQYLLQAMTQYFGVSSASDFIGILKTLGLSPLAVASQINTFYGGSWRRWVASYRLQGYTALDTAAWFKATDSYGNDYDQCVILLKQDAGYSLNEITTVLKETYGLSDNQTYQKLLGYSTNNPNWRWWTPGDITAAVNSVYGEDILQNTIQGMKAAGAPASQITGTLIATFGITTPGDLAAYLQNLGFTEADILTALARNFRGLYGKNLILMLSGVVSGTFKDDPVAKIGLIIASYEDVQGKFGYPINCIRLLQEAGFDINALTSTLKNVYGLSALNAGKALIDLSSYTTDQTIQAIQNGYGVDFIAVSVHYWKTDVHYQLSAEAAGRQLIKDFAVNTPEAIATRLKEAGYTQREVLTGLRYIFPGAKVAAGIQMLEQVLQNVYNQTLPCLKPVVEAYCYSPDYPTRAAVDFLTEQGYPVSETVRVLKDEYAISSTDVVNLLIYCQPCPWTSIVSVVTQVFGQDPVPAYVDYLKNNQGYWADQIVSELMDRLGIQDAIKLTNYLHNAGYSDDQILHGIVTWDNYAITVLKTLHPTESPLQLVARVRASAELVNSSYGDCERTAAGLFKEFPNLDYATVAKIFNSTGFPSFTIYSWLYFAPIPNSQKDGVAAILGSRNSDDLHLEWSSTVYTLVKMGYGGVQAAQWMMYDRYSNIDIFEAIRGNYGVNDRNDAYDYSTLIILKQAGFSIDDLAEVSLLAHKQGCSGDNPHSDIYYAIMAVAGLGYALPDVTRAMVKGGAQPRYILSALYDYRYDRFYYALHDPYWARQFSTHHACTEADLSLTNIANWIYNSVATLPEDKQGTIDVNLEIACGLHELCFSSASGDEVFNAMSSITYRSSIGWQGKLSQTDVDLLDDFISLVNSIISFGGDQANEHIISKVTALNELRHGGFTTREMTYLLKDTGASYLTNLIMQAIGGYNVLDAWASIMSVSSYRLSFTFSLLWTAATILYKFDTYIRVTVFVVQHYDLFIRIGSMALSLASGAYDYLNGPSSSHWLTASGLLDSSDSDYGISGVTVNQSSDNAVTLQGTVTSGSGKEVILLVRKPNADEKSQAQTSLDSLDDAGIKGIVDYFDATLSTESTSSGNFAFNYCSSQTPGNYAFFLKSEDGSVPLTATQILFLKSLEGKVGINGTATYGQILAADISGLINVRGSLKYQWKRGSLSIPGAVSANYTVTPEDIGQTLSLTVSGDGVYAAGSISSAPTDTVAIAKPGLPVLLSKTTNSVTLVPGEGLQFRVNDGDWQDSNIFRGLSPFTLYIFTSRLKDYPNSDPSDGLRVYTAADSSTVNVENLDHFTAALEDAGVNTINITASFNLENEVTITRKVTLTSNNASTIYATIYSFSTGATESTAGDLTIGGNLIIAVGSDRNHPGLGLRVSTGSTATLTDNARIIKEDGFDSSASWSGQAGWLDNQAVGVRVIGGGQFTINGHTAISIYYGRGILAQNGGQVNISGSALVNVPGGSNNGVYDGITVDSGSVLNVNGGSVSAPWGTGITLDGSTANISGPASIEGIYNGAAISISNNSTANINLAVPGPSLAGVITGGERTFLSRLPDAITMAAGQSRSFTLEGVDADLGFTVAEATDTALNASTADGKTVTLSSTQTGTFNLELSEAVEYNVYGIAQETALNLSLPVKVVAPSGITGKITDGSDPIAGATVTLTGYGQSFSGNTTANGSYALTNVPVGTGYTLSARQPGYDDNNISGITVQETGNSPVNLALKAKPTIVTGTVQYHGQGAFNAHVVLSGNGQDYIQTISYAFGQEGHYSFTDVPSGTYTLTAIPPDTWSKVLSTTVCNVYVAPREITTVNFNFTDTSPDTPTGTLTGSVIETSHSYNSPGEALVGIPINGQVYRAITQSIDWQSPYSFYILTVPAGTYYTVTAGKPGFYSKNLPGVNVTANTTTQCPDIMIYKNDTSYSPTISNIQDQFMETDGNTGPLSFTVGDVETEADSLKVTATSSDTTLVPVNNIVLKGYGSNRMVTVTPASGFAGEAQISITVTDTDGLSSASCFEVYVAKASTSLMVTPVTGNYTGTMDLTATLLSNGVGLAGKNIIFEFLGMNYEPVITDSQGVATLKGLSLGGMNPGSYGTYLKATFIEDDGYYGCEGRANLIVRKVNQMITFNPLSDKSVGDADFTINATATSGLSVAYSVSGNCTLHGNTVHLTGPGRCTITASQAGNTYWEVAQNVSQSFTVYEAAPASSSITLVSSANPQTTGQPVTFTANVSTNGTVTPTGTITFLDGAVTLGVVSLNGTGGASLTTSALATGSHAITAAYSGDAMFSSNTSGMITQSVNKGSLLFNNLTSPVITSGTASVSLNGTLSGNGLYPSGEMIVITLNSVSQNATVEDEGRFSTGFVTGNLAAGIYPISYNYAGDTNFNAVSANSTLTVQALVSAPVLACYSDAAYNASCTSFALAVNHVYIKGTNFAAGTYRVNYYDNNGVKVYSQEGITVASDEILKSDYYLKQGPSAASGTWHVLVQPNSGCTNFVSRTYTTIMISPATYGIIANGTFTAASNAIPELPTAVTAIGVALLSILAYWWISRRKDRIID